MTNPYTSTNVVARLGFYGCAHLGYRMNAMARRHASGLNLREVDGYRTYDLVYRDMIAAGVDAICDGGDTFHTHQPSTRSIDEALKIDDLRVHAGIEVHRNSGNHDATSGGAVSAVAALHRPSLGSFSVFPDRNRPADEEPFGPHQGLYEVHQPIPDTAVYLHMVSHYGLNPALADKGIHINPTPIPDAINILVAHGIFEADDRLFGAADRHGAVRQIPAEWVDRGWDASILSDYHTPGPIPGFGVADGRRHGQVWMTGSLIGRGFSDDLCARGWLQVDVGADGHLTITHRPVWRRPQNDFDPIDASGRTVDDINEIIRARLATADWWDSRSADLTGDGGWILRQRIRGASPTQRQGCRALAAEWAAAAGRAAYWGVTFDNPQSPNASRPAAPNRRTVHRTRDTINYLDDFTRRTEHGRVGAVLDAVSKDLADTVLNRVHGALSGLT